MNTSSFPQGLWFGFDVSFSLNDYDGTSKSKDIARLSIVSSESNRASQHGDSFMHVEQLPAGGWRPEFFFSATTGIVQNDLKPVIAYSTCSQLGYMVSHYFALILKFVHYFKFILYYFAKNVFFVQDGVQSYVEHQGSTEALRFSGT